MVRATAEIKNVPCRERGECVVMSLVMAVSLEVEVDAVYVCV